MAEKSTLCRDRRFSFESDAHFFLIDFFYNILLHPRVAIDQFRSDGQRIAGSACDYQFISQAGNNGATGAAVSDAARQRRGKFYSPLYPSLYPPRSRCFYHFYGRLVCVIISSLFHFISTLFGYKSVQRHLMADS